MSNPSFADGRIKIGKSDRDPTTRKEELETTGVPEPFVVEYYAFVEDHHRLERELHRYFSSFRPNKNREFFTCSIPEVINVVRDKSVILHEKVNYKSPEEIEKIRLEKEQIIQKHKEQELRKKKEDDARLLQEREVSDRQLYIKNLCDSFKRYIDNKDIDCISRCPKKNNLINLFIVSILNSLMFGFFISAVFVVIFSVKGYNFINVYIFVVVFLSFVIFSILVERNNEGVLCLNKCRNFRVSAFDFIDKELSIINNHINASANWRNFVEYLERSKLPELRKKIEFVFADNSSQPLNNNHISSEEIRAKSSIENEGVIRNEDNENIKKVSELNNSLKPEVIPEKVKNASFSTIETVCVSCSSCGSSFKVTLNRYENRAICPDCFKPNNVNIKW